MQMETQINLMLHGGGVLNAFLALQNFERGGAWIVLGVANVIGLLVLARAWQRMEERRSK